MSIWTSCRNRPVLALSEVFTAAVSDISWTCLSAQTDQAATLPGTDRVIMCASSVDGSLVIVDLGDSLGTVLSSADLDRHLAQLYGPAKRPTIPSTSPSSLLHANSRDMASSLEEARPYVSIESNPLLASLQHNLSFLKAQALPTAIPTNGSNNHADLPIALSNTLLSKESLATPTPAYTPQDILSLQKSSRDRVTGKKRVCPVTIQTSQDLVGLAPTLGLPLSAVVASSDSAVVDQSSAKLDHAIAPRDSELQGDEMQFDTYDDSDVPPPAHPTAEEHRPAKLSRPSSMLDSKLGDRSLPLASSSSSSSSSSFAAERSPRPNTSSLVAARSVTGVSKASHLARSVSPVPPSEPPAHSLSITFRGDDVICAVPYPALATVLTRSSHSSTKQGTPVESITRKPLQCLVKTPPPAYSASYEGKADLFLSAEGLERPLYLQNIKRYNSESVYTLSLKSSASPSQSPPLWTSSIVGEVTSLAAHTLSASPDGLEHSNGHSKSTTHLPYKALGNSHGHDDNGGSSDESKHEGICAVGCLDGSLHLISLACGMRIKAPMVLGTPVVCIDIIAPSTHGSPTATSGVASLFADHQPAYDNNTGDFGRSLVMLTCTADGEVRVFDIYTDANKQYRLVSKHKVSIKPAMQSMRIKTASSFAFTSSSSTTTDPAFHQNGNSGNSPHHQYADTVTLKRCQMDRNGVPVITLAHHTSSSRNGSGNGGQRPPGGPHQAFRYDSEGDVWMRIADMRHALSRY